MRQEGSEELVQSMAETKAQVTELAHNVSALGDELRALTLRSFSQKTVVDYEALGDKIALQIERQLESAMPVKLIQSPSHPPRVNVHPALMQYLSQNIMGQDPLNTKQSIMRMIHEEVRRVEHTMAEREREFRSQLQNGGIRVDISAIERTMVLTLLVLLINWLFFSWKS